MDTEKLKKLLKYTIYADKFKYHNQMIDFLDKFYEPENFPKKLINFDLHMDLKFNLKCYRNGVENWVIHALKKYNIEEYYWVLPTNYFHNCKRINNLINQDEDRQKNTDQNSPFLLKKTFEFQSCKNRVWNVKDEERKEKFISQKTENPEDFKKITIYYCTKENLPDFNKDDVIVSVDADYFSNNGYDTYEDYKYSPIDINKDFEEFVDLLLNKNIYPTYFGLCLSKNYVEDLESSEAFYDEILKNQLCPIKFNINYTYTDLNDDDYSYSNAYFYKSDKLINIFLITNDLSTEEDIIKTFKLDEVINDDGIFKIGYFYKETTNVFNHPIAKLYPYEYNITKIVDNNGYLEVMTRLINEKIKNLKKNQIKK